MDTFANPTSLEMAPGGQYGLAKYGSDANLLVVFYNKAVEDPVESMKLGRRYTKNQIYITIQHPGETHTKIDRPANEADKYRFRDHWSKFVSNRSQIPEGTPIDLLFPNYPAIAENLRAYGVYTIEQCASLQANAIDNIGRGAQEYVNRAQRYLESADKGAAFHKMQEELEKRDNEIASLKSLIEQMKSRIDHLTMVNDDPIRGAQQPPFVPGHDVQSERINANHVTKDIEKKVARSGRRSKGIEQDTILTDPFAGQDQETEKLEKINE